MLSYSNRELGIILMPFASTGTLLLLLWRVCVVRLGPLPSGIYSRVDRVTVRELGRSAATWSTRTTTQKKSA